MFVDFHAQSLVGKSTKKKLLEQTIDERHGGKNQNKNKTEDLKTRFCVIFFTIVPVTRRRATLRAMFYV